jgi:hydrogenase-4 membrane subunit HyfE
MNLWLIWTLVALGLAAVAVRQPLAPVALVTAQATLLVTVALREADHTQDLVAAGALGLRTVVLAGLFGLLAVKSRGSRPVEPGLSAVRRTGFATALAMAMVWLVPNFGLGSRNVERAVLVLVGFGLAIAATSRVTLQQVLGIVVIENALVLAVLRLPGTSWIIELGLAFDLILLAAVAGVFHHRIVAEFGAGDTGALRSLRD